MKKDGVVARQTAVDLELCRGRVRASVRVLNRRHAAAATAPEMASDDEVKKGGRGGARS